MFDMTLLSSEPNARTEDRANDAIIQHHWIVSSLHSGKGPLALSAGLGCLQRCVYAH
jgi:hypothetical protein